MRSIRTLWREPAYLLGALAIVAIILYNAAFVKPANYEGYWVSTFSNATIFLIFSAPVASASAAIVAARARRSGIWSLPLARGRGLISFRLLLPSFVGAFVAQLFGTLLLGLISGGAPGRVPLEVVLAWAAILTFHLSVGYLLGRYLPMAASVPLSIFVSYCWLGFAWTVSYFPIRYLAGLIITACCSVDTTLDERAVVAVVVFSLPMSGAFLIFATVAPAGSPRRGVPLTGIAAIAFMVIAFTVGLSVAQGLGGQPVVPRNRGDLRCTGKAPAICVYPEQLEGSDPRPTLRAAYTNIRDEHVAVPATITTSNTNADRSSLRVVVTTRPTPAQLVYTTAVAMLPNDVAPYCGDGSDYPKRLDVAAVATWWLQKVAAKGVVDAASLPQPHFTPDSERLIQAFSRLGGKQQRDWFLAASPTLWHCSSKPIGIPSR